MWGVSQSVWRADLLLTGPTRSSSRIWLVLGKQCSRQTQKLVWLVNSWKSCMTQQNCVPLFCEAAVSVWAFPEIWRLFICKKQQQQKMLSSCEIPVVAIKVIFIVSPPSMCHMFLCDRSHHLQAASTFWALRFIKIIFLKSTENMYQTHLFKPRWTQQQQQPLATRTAQLCGFFSTELLGGRSLQRREDWD